MFLVMQQFFSRLCVCLCIWVTDFFNPRTSMRKKTDLYSFYMHICRYFPILHIYHITNILFSSLKQNLFKLISFFSVWKARNVVCWIVKPDLLDWKWGFTLTSSGRFSSTISFFFLSFSISRYVWPICQLFGIDDRVDGQMTLRKQTNKNIYLFFIERLHITDQKVRLSCSFFLLFSVVTIFILWF